MRSAEPTRTQARLAELDLLRAVAAIAVVLIHATALLLGSLPRDSRAFLWNSVLNQAARFSIGAFVLITAAALYYTYGDRARFSAFDFYRRRLRGVAIPYLFWSAVYILWVARVERHWSGLPARYAGSLLHGDAFAHLYFLLMIFQFYLLFPLVRTAVRNRWLDWTGVAIMLVQLYLTAGVFYHVGYARIPWLAGAIHRSDRLFPWWMGYFALGALFVGHLQRWRLIADRYLWLLVGASSALLLWMMVEYVAYLQNPNVSLGWAASEFRPSANLYSLVIIVALLAFSRRIATHPGWLRRGLVEVGRHSFGIYLVHPLVLQLYQRALVHLHLALGPAPYFLLALAVALGASYMASRVFAALPYGAWLVGTTATGRQPRLAQASG